VILEVPGDVGKRKADDTGGLFHARASLDSPAVLSTRLSVLRCIHAYPECDQHHIGKEAAMSESWSGEFYCVKCKDKREATGEVHVSEKGTRMAKGICPVCGTKLNRILGKA
jgi:hypothetical protein